MAKRRRKAAGLLPAAVEEINRLRAEWATLKDSDLLVEKTSSSSKKPKNHNNKKRSSSPELCNEVLRGVVALVEVGSERRALPLRAALSALGASVVPLWNPFVTHVIWGKGGDSKTRAAARASAARVVSPLWVEACSASNRRLSEKAYPAAPRPSDIPSPLALLKLLKKAEAKMGTSSDQAKNIPDQSEIISLLDSDSDETPKTENNENNCNDTSNTAGSSLDRTSEPSNASNGNCGIKDEKSSGSKRHSAVICFADSSTTPDTEVGVNKRARRALPRSMSISEVNIVISDLKKRSSSWSPQDGTSSGSRPTRQVTISDLRNILPDIVLKSLSPSSVRTAPPVESGLDSPVTIEDDEESNGSQTEQREEAAGPSKPPARSEPPAPTATESAGLDSPIIIEDDDEPDDERDEEGSNTGRSTQSEKKDVARTVRFNVPETVVRAPTARAHTALAPDAPGPSPGTSSTASCTSGGSSRAKPGSSGAGVKLRSVAVGTDPEPLFSGQFGALKRRAIDEPGYSGSFLGRFASMTGRFVPVPAAYSSAVAPGRFVPISSTETESQAAINESRFPRNVWPRSRAHAILPPFRPRTPDDVNVRVAQAPAPSQDTVYSSDGKIRIVLTGMSRVERKRALMAMGKLRGAQCQRSVNYKTTHVVVGLFGRDLGGDDSGASAPRSRLLSSPLRSRYPASLRVDDERTLRTFSAIAGAARGCRVVFSSWLYDSEAAQRWVSCRPYAVPEFRDTAEKAFLERQAYGMLDKEYAYNVFYGRRVRLSQFVENRRACEELLILCGAVVLDENGAICHNGDLDIDDVEPEAGDGGPFARPVQGRRIGPFLDAHFGRPPRNGPDHNRSHSLDGSQQNHGAENAARTPSPRPALLPDGVPPRNQVIRASPNAQRLLWRGHDRIRFSEVMIGALYGQVSSRWVFDSVTHGRMHSIRHYIPLGISRHLVAEAEVEVVDTNGISRF